MARVLIIFHFRGRPMHNFISYTLLLRYLLAISSVTFWIVILMERPNFDLLSFMEEEDEMDDLIQPEDLLAETDNLGTKKKTKSNISLITKWIQKKKLKEDRPLVIS